MTIFQDRVAVIYLLREKIKFAYVGLNKKPNLKNTGEYPWSAKTITNVLPKIKQKIGPNIRVVVADDLSYLATISIAKDIKDIRKFVFDRVSETIPEDLLDKDWDFKKISESLTEKQILIFSPVKSVFNLFLDEAIKAGFKIESVEPENSAIKRNANPIIGTAIKKDIFGKDEDVLNLEAENNHKSWPMLIIISSLIIVLLALFVAVFLNQKWFYTKGPQAPASTQTLLRSSLKLEVLNGSGIASESAEIQSLLETKGYQEVVLKDVEPYEFNGIQIEIKGDKQNYINIIKSDLSPNFAINSVSESLDRESVFDSIIMLGRLK